MALHQIIAGSGINRGRAVVKHQEAYTSREVVNFPTNTSISASTSGQEPNYGVWGLGTGQLITTGGSVVFNATNNGGALESVVLRNAGTNRLYYGYNSDTVAVGSGGFPLGTGEGIILDTPLVHKIWAIGDGGNTILQAQGAYKRNINAI